MIAPTRFPFLTRQTIKIFTSKAKETSYRFEPLPDYRFRGEYGIYVHVPFCGNFCSFCPYYKVKSEPEAMKRFTAALVREIRLRDFSGKPAWFYIGGGTPNTLSIGGLEPVLNELRKKADIAGAGVELIPYGLSGEYLSGLKDLGIGRVSLGIESLDGRLLARFNRAACDAERLRRLIDHAQTIGLWVNCDLMVGFEGQRIYTFRRDIERIIEMRPNQLTVYPVMTIRGTALQNRTLDDMILFRVVEEAGETLGRAGYRRRTLWTWGRDDEYYDSSYDELGTDYIGLGPSGISSTPGWIAVNPPLEGYLAGFASAAPHHPMVFLSRHLKLSAHEHWRKFGMMLYERKIRPSLRYPPYLNLFILTLILSGHSVFGRLTRKGRRFAHEVTRAVVETKSFPLQYRGCVENWSEYERFIREGTPAGTTAREVKA